MKKQTLTNFLFRFTLALALTMAIWSPLQSQATEPVKGKSLTDSKMMEGCQEMMKKKQEMMAEMKAQDVELPFDFCKHTIPREGAVPGGLRGLAKTGVCLQNGVVLNRIFDA